MTSEADRNDRSGRSGRLRALVLGTGLIWLLVMPAAAQMFSDRPPPVPPGLVPEPTAPAMNLAPPGGPASVPGPGPLLTQPSVAAVPPVVPPSPSTAGQAVLSLTARYGKDLPVITGGLVWRVFADRPDESGTFK